MEDLRLRTERSPERLDLAARIWNAATAARDGSPFSSVELARARIEAALDEGEEGVLVTAWDAADTAVGFAAVSRAADGDVEIHYLGVDPSGWNRGVGSQLLRQLHELLRARGCVRAHLWVYADNAPAIALYERHGWRADGETRVHPLSQRVERHLVRAPV